MLARALIMPFAVLSVAAAAAPPPAQREEVVITGKKVPPGYEPVTTKVKYGDLNLATERGIKELERRVAHGVSGVCPTPPGNSPDYEMKDYEACRTFAMDGARPQMDRAIAAAKAKQGGGH